MEPAVSVAPAPPLFSWRSLVREYRDHLSIWFVYLSAIGLLHATLANFPEQEFAKVGISRPLFIATTPFPLIWFVAYFVLRIRNSRRIRSAWQAYLALGALAVGVPAAIALFHKPHPLDHDQLVGLFEITQLLWVGLFVGHILLSRGWQALVTFFGVTFAYGLMLENTGIVMGYFFEPSFKIYLWFLPAPLCTMLGWCLVLYIVISLTERFTEWVPWLAEGLWRRVVLATTIALCLDAQLDPLASMSGVFWRWNELLPRAFFGVPIINFAAWFGAIFAYSIFVFRVLDRDDWSPGRKNWELFLRVPLSCLLGGALCFTVMAVVEGGFDGPTFQIFQAFGDRLLPY